MTKQTIEQLQKRYNEFRDQKIRVQAELEGAQKRLADLQQQANEEFGTHDLDELTAKLKKTKSENEEKRKTYQESLDKVEAELARVEADFDKAHAESETDA